MQKKLGLHITPTSVSWALVSTDENGEKRLVKTGLRQFKDAVEHTTAGEVSSAQLRTLKKGLRKLHRRKRNRKADLLKVLVSERLCPAIPEADIKYWRLKKIFPNNADLRDWLSVNAKEDKNPYTDRHECLHRRLDLSLETDRHMLGRALYHLSQRRGYLSNKKDSTDDKESTKTENAIRQLTEQMQEAGVNYLGDFFYSIIGKKKIRSRLLSRKEHIEAEFNEICRVQQLDEDLVKRLHFCIFRNTPIKSQKWAVGRCVYLKNKPRCKVTHPDFEEYRMLSTIANFKIGAAGGESLRPLTDEEKDRILPLFFRKSKPHFDFAEIASVLSGTKAPKNASGKQLGDCVFNYHLDQSIPGCPVTAAIISSLEGADCRNWRTVAASRYIRHKDDIDEVVNDIWHTLEFYDNAEMEARWFMDNFGMSDKDAVSLTKAKLQQNYASLSLCAIRKILPYLRRGEKLHKAIYLAGLNRCVSPATASDAKKMSEIRENVAILVDDYLNEKDTRKRQSSLEENIRDYLLSVPDSNPDRLWVPNAIDSFVPVYNETSGRMELPSPISASLKNPLVTRCLVQAGQVINTLIREGLADPQTRISYTLDGGINSRNMRTAIYRFQKDNRARRDTIMKALEDLGIPVTEDNILRYRLWDEQKHMDILSGEQIGVSDAFDGGKTALENIIPARMGGGNYPENLLLVTMDTYDVKHGKFCVEAFKKEALLDTIKAIGWDDTVRTLEGYILSNTKKAKNATTVDAKNAAVMSRNLNQLTLDYWKSKIHRITSEKDYMDSEKLLNGRYGAIGKFLQKYLASVFRTVHPLGQDGIAEFRKLWGIPLGKSGDYRDCMLSAITAACIDRSDYDAFCRYQKDIDIRRAYGRPLERFPLPWETFGEDARQAVGTALSSSLCEDKLTKRGKWKMRDKTGRILLNADGEPMYRTGETARGALHHDTFIGMINNNGTMAYVTRVPAESIEEKDVDSIVDPDLRETFRNAIVKYGSVKEANANGGIVTGPDGFPVRHVRTFNRAKSAITLKKHPERSMFDYKRNVYVTNEENDAMVIRGYGKEASFSLVNNLDAVKTKRIQQDRDTRVIRKKILVIFYEKDISELLTLSRTELSKRLHKVEGLGKQILFRHHLDIKSEKQKGFWTPDGNTPPCFVQTYNKYPFAVEGRDFMISKTGDIKFLF